MTKTSLSGSITSERIYFNGLHVAAAHPPSGPVNYLFQDHLGGEHLVTDAIGGSICQDIDTLPFGSEIGYITTCASSYRFAGMDRDYEDSAQLDYDIARYDNSRLGRFLSPDEPFAGQDSGDPQSWNLYSYVQNNPVTNVDPDGHDCIYFSSAGNAFVKPGDCISENDNGIYVDGTVDPKSLRYNSTTGSWSFSYTAYDTGNIGVGTITGAKPPGPEPPMDSGVMSPGLLGPGDFVLLSGVKMPAYVTEFFGQLFGSILGEGAGDAAEIAAKQAAVDIDNLTEKIVGQMATRGWTKQEILQTVRAGKAFNVVNKLTGGPATEYVSSSGKFVVVDNATKQVIQVSGPGFLPNHLVQP